MYKDIITNLKISYGRIIEFYQIIIIPNCSKFDFCFFSKGFPLSSKIFKEFPIFIFISILIGIYVLVSLIMGTAVHGWASLMLSIWLVGGVTLLGVGGVGIYIGKMYNEVKHRPLYTVKEFLD